MVVMLRYETTRKHSRKLYQPVLIDHSQVPHKALCRLEHFMVYHPTR